MTADQPFRHGPKSTERETAARGTAHEPGGGTLWRKSWSDATRRVTGRRTRRLGLLLALTIGAAGATQPAAAASNCTTSGATVTCTYTGTGEQTFTVPGGVTSLQVTAIGGAGGSSDLVGRSGHGAQVTTTLAVNAGDTLYVEVGSNGDGSGAGGFGGGGAGGAGGGSGGGGASDVQTVHCATASSCIASTPKADLRVVAGGGGGEGPGSDAGNAGASDGSGSAGSGDSFDPECAYPGLPCAGQGGGGTTTAGGAGGGGEPADSGAFPAGGSGASGKAGGGGAGGGLPSDNNGSGGGGGGGGYYGGGGGGGAHYSAGGGGGGSSYSAGTSTSFSTDTTGTPEVVITYTQPTLTITANNQSMTYGGAVPALTASYSGFVNGDTAASLTTAPTCTTTATSSSLAGHYAITCSGTVDPNYRMSYVAGTLTIGQAALTITASSASMTYGDTIPAIVPSYSGFVNGDTAAALTRAPICGTTATSASPVMGSPYATSCTGAADPNYTVTYAAGTLTVTKAALTVTADDQSKTYGGGVPALTASYSGFRNGDTARVVSGSPACATMATRASPVAGSPYAITCDVSTLTAANYTFHAVAGALTVNPAPLTITANDQSKVYGAADPVFTVNYSGLVNSDTPSAITGLSVSHASATSGVGSYPIVPSGAMDSNYAITFVNGTETITPAPLTIIADDQSTVYGQPDPTFTVTPQGLVNGDTLASLQGTLNVATTATQFSPPGMYTLTPSGLSSPNYSISYGAGTLTIGQDASTVTLTSSANPAPFGQPVTLTANVGAASPDAGTPTGTVTFLDGGTPIGTATLAGGQASLTTAVLLGGTHSLSVSYGGDPNFTANTSAALPQAITFSRTLNGTVDGPQTIHSGESVLISGAVNGPLTVQAGGTVALMGAQVNGPLRASSAGAVALCGSTVGGPVSITGSTGFVRIGGGSDDPGVSCASDTLQGPLTLSGNKGGVEVEGARIAGPLSLTNTSGAAPGEDSAAPELEGNTIGGPLSCSGNTPPPTSDGRPNTVSGPKSGQCGVPGI